mgnify:CR=1 FL=1
MIEIKGVLSVEESLNGNLNLGVDYYKGDKGGKGDKGDTPVKGVDYYTPKDKEELKAEISSEVVGLDSLTNSDILAIWQTY